MIQKLAHVTVLVKDQEEALRFYTEKLGLEKRQDDRMGDFRWLTVAPPGQPDVAIVLRAKIGARAGPIWHYVALGGTTWHKAPPTCTRTWSCPVSMDT